MTTAAPHAAAFTVAGAHTGMPYAVETDLASAERWADKFGGEGSRAIARLAPRETYRSDPTGATGIRIIRTR